MFKGSRPVHTAYHDDLIGIEYICFPNISFCRFYIVYQRFPSRNLTVHGTTGPAVVHSADHSPNLSEKYQECTVYRLGIADTGDVSNLWRDKWRPCEFGGKTFLSAGAHQHVG